MKQTTKHKKIGIYATWKALPEEERIPKTYREMAEQLGMTPRGLRNWDKELDNGDYDSTKWLTERTPQADAALLAAMKRGNAQALKIYYQLIGKYEEKPEGGIGGLSPDEITRRNFEAERRYREWKRLE